MKDRRLSGKARIKARRAARIPTQLRYSTDRLDGLKADELRVVAKELGLTKYSHLKVAELRDAIYASPRNRVSAA